MNAKLNSNKLIAVSGVKNSGKNVVSSMLQYCLSVPKILRQYWIYKLFGKCFHKKYKLLAFADPVKQILSILLNVPVKRFYSREFKELYCVNMSTLECYSNITNWNKKRMSDSKFSKLVKNLDPCLSTSDLTIRQLMQYVATEVFMKYFGKQVWINCTLKHATGNAIITDLRFKEEYDVVKKYGGVVIYIKRPDTTFGQHASEKEMEELLNNNKYDIVINNDSNLKSLFNQVKQL